MSTRTNLLGMAAMAVAGLALSASANAAILWQAPIQGGTDSGFGGDWAVVNQSTIPTPPGAPAAPSGSYVATRTITVSPGDMGASIGAGLTLPADRADSKLYLSMTLGQDAADGNGTQFFDAFFVFKDGTGTGVGDRHYSDRLSATTVGWHTMVNAVIDYSDILTAASVSGITMRFVAENTTTPVSKTFYMDKFEVSYTAVPEPVSMGLVGLTAIGLLRRQRKA